MKTIIIFCLLIIPLNFFIIILFVAGFDRFFDDESIAGSLCIIAVSTYIGLTATVSTIAIVEHYKLYED